MKRFKFFIRLINMLYPSRCPLCNNIIEQSQFYCENCSRENPKNTQKTYILKENDEDVYCVSPFRYSGEIKKAIRRFKFKGCKFYDKAFAKMMAESVKDSFEKTNFDVITCVPLSFKRKFSRGYNQSELLAKGIGNILNIQFKNLLYKSKNNVEQHKLSREDRKKNVIGVYSAKNMNYINNSIILLCDDIVTTGSTLKECTKVLYKNGAKKVYCVTISNAEAPWLK